MINRTYDLEDRLIDFVLKIIIRNLLVNAQIVSPVLSENEELIAIFAKSRQTVKYKISK